METVTAEDEDVSLPRAPEEPRLELKLDQASISENGRISLFRPEVDPRRFRHASTLLVSKSGIFSMITAISAGALSILLILLVCYGQLTRTVGVSGVLVSSAAVANVVSPQPGTIIEQRRKLWDQVKKGDTLFLISRDVDDSEGSPILKRISIETSAQIVEVTSEITLNDELFEKTTRSLLEQSLEAEAELDAIQANIDAQSLAIARNAQTVADKTKLLSSGIATTDQLNTAKVQQSSDQYTLASLRTSAAAAKLTIENIRAQLEELPISHAAQAAQLNEKKANLEVSLAQNELSREFALVAPVSGIISAMPGQMGEAVNSQDLLATVTPPDDILQAQLLVPSSSSGFLSVGQDVAVQYEAFPYQKFGYAMGKVSMINNVALKQADIDQLEIPISTTEPVFSVTVDLKNQSVLAYGKEQPLHAGMTLQANIAQERRSIYEWILDPLLSAKGTVLSSGGKP